jgi:hypothetical protein
MAFPEICMKRGVSASLLPYSVVCGVRRRQLCEELRCIPQFVGLLFALACQLSTLTGAPHSVRLPVASICSAASPTLRGTPLPLRTLAGLVRLLADSLNH